MAIPKDLEALLEGFTPEETTLFDNLLTKQYTAAKAKDPNAPTLQEGWLRQQEFDKRSNEWKTKLTEAEKLAAARQRWFEENKPIHDNALKNARELEEKYEAAEKQRVELETRLQEALTRRAAEGGEQVDPAELAALVQAETKKYGFLTKSEMDAIIDTKAAQLAKDEATRISDERITAAEKRLWSETFPQMANHAADIAEIAYDHKVEFGEPFDREKFTALLAERKITDFKEGYKQFVAPRREEVLFKKKVEDEVKQRVSAMAANGGMQAPPGGPAPLGALQMKIQKDQAATTLSAASAAAAAELRAEGSF